MEVNCQPSLFLFCCILELACLRLTWHGAAKDLQPHAQRAVPALGDDSNVTSQHWLGQLVHHWSVLIVVRKEQLDVTEKRDLGRLQRRHTHTLPVRRRVIYY